MNVYPIIIAAIYSIGLLCASATGAGAAQSETLRIYTWADYLSDELVKKFERESGISVEVTKYDSNDELLNTLNSGHSGFDLATPTTSLIDKIIKNGLIEKINAYELDSYANIDDDWRSPQFDIKNEYTAPFDWGTTSYVVDTAVYKGSIDTLQPLFNPPEQLRGRVSFLVGGEEAIKMGLTYLGLPQCSTDPGQLEQVMALVRPQLSKATIATISTAIDYFTSDRIVVGMAWNGDALRARMLKPTLRYVYPREGVVVWMDLLVVPKGAPHMKEARAFIDFVLKPENIAIQSNFTHYANVVRGSDAYMSAELLKAPEVIVPSGIKLNFHQHCPSEVTEKHVKVWENELREYTK